MNIKKKKKKEKKPNAEHTNQFMKKDKNLDSNSHTGLDEPRIQIKHGEAAFGCKAARKSNKLPAEVTFIV